MRQIRNMIGILILAACGGAASADVMNMIGNCSPPNIVVRGKRTFHNNTGQDADDFHVYMYQNDRRSVVVTGGMVTVSGAFTNAGLAFDTRNGRNRMPPPGNHGVDIDLSGGVVPNGASITVEFKLCMNERNILKLEPPVWTIGGAPIPPGLSRKAKGFRVRRPRAGGGGGNPGDPTGGGAGAQEGNGGVGNFIHSVCIENDSDAPIEVVELKLLASTTDYANPDSDIDWAMILPMMCSPDPLPATIAGNDAWCCDFETTGAYLGGHVYMQYVVNESPSFAGVGMGQTEFGDHPPEELCDDPGCATTYGPPLGACDARGAGCIDDLYEYDCDLSGETWIQGATCEGLGGGVPALGYVAQAGAVLFLLCGVGYAAKRRLI